MGAHLPPHGMRARLMTTPDDLGPCQQYCEELKVEVRALRALADQQGATVKGTIATAEAVRSLVLRACEDFTRETGATIRIEARPLVVRSIGGTPIGDYAGYSVDVEARVV